VKKRNVIEAGRRKPETQKPTPPPPKKKKEKRKKKQKKRLGSRGDCPGIWVGVGKTVLKKGSER